MATQHVERNLLNLYREENILLVCFFLPLKSDKNVWHLQPSFSTWRPLAFLPVNPLIIKLGVNLISLIIGAPSFILQGLVQSHNTGRRAPVGLRGDY